MRALYLVKTGDHTFGHQHMFKDWAAIDNEDGTSLLSVRFHGEEEQEYFESLEGVCTFTKSQQVSAEQVAHLAHIGVKPEHKTEDILRLARMRYRSM